MCQELCIQKVLVMAIMLLWILIQMVKLKIGGLFLMILQ